MYKINVEEKSAEKIQETTFSKIGLKERNDIQEWIANNPDILEYSSDLLIIQKEFDGFSDTDRRLDLLALDKQGNLVVIENKRDDTGKDVVWQAINYASFCSTLTSQEVIKIYQDYLNSLGIEKNAEESIRDFFDDETVIFPTNIQKIILVSREFRKEVLSAAQWLNSNGIDITCIKFIPYSFGGDLLLEVDRILPQEEMKDYAIKLSRKNADTKNQEATNSKAVERNIKFWKFFASKFNKKKTPFENINSWDNNKNSWIGASSGIGHSTYFDFVISDNEYRVELYIDNKDRDYNKKVFNALYLEKEEIEKEGENYKFRWQMLNEKRASRIAIVDKEFSLKSTENWGQIADFLIKAMQKLIEIMEKRKNIVENIEII